MDLPCRDGERHRRERGRAGAVRRQGHERRRAAAGRAGGRGGRARTRPASSSATCRCRRNGSGGPCVPPRPRATRADATDLRARRAARRHARRGEGAGRRQGGEPRRDGAGPRPAGPARVSRSRPRPAGTTWRPAGPRASTTSCASAMAAVEGAVGRRFGDPADPLAGQRALGCAGLDARDDGHDPRPRAQRRDRRRAWPQAPATPPSPRRAAAVRGDVPRRSSASTTCPTTRGSSSGSRSRRCSARGTATARGRTARREGIPDDLGTAVDRPGDGVRQPRRRLRDRRRVHAQPGDRRAGALRRRPVRRAGRGRRRRHPSRPSRSPRSTSGCRRSPRSCAATADRLERHYARPVRHRVHDRGRAGCGCSRSASASAARRRRCGSRSTWPRIRRSR